MSSISSIGNTNANFVVSSTSKVQNQTKEISDNKNNLTSDSSNINSDLKKGSVPILSFASSIEEPKYETKKLVSQDQKTSIEYPQFTNIENKEAQEKINAYFKTKAENSFKKPEEPVEGDITDGAESYESSVSSAKRTSNTLSVTTSEYSYFEGAAHGMGATITTNFDLKTGEKIELKDLFKEDSKFLDKISKFATGKLQNELGSDVLLKEGVAPSEENFSNFEIKDNAIEFTFTTYQVGPYAVGEPTVSIPLDVLDKEINPSSVLGDKVKTDLKETSYSGKINNKYSIESNLKFDDSLNKVYGTYKYSGKKDEINVSGRVGQDGSFKMEESANGVHTGSFTGKFSPDKTTATGTWSTADGKKSMPFSIKVK